MAQDTCSITGCQREPNGARGMCRSHYAKWYRYGDPLASRTPGPAPIPASERFAALVDVRGLADCWIWQGAPKPNGYGRFWSGEREVYAHRWSYEFFQGPIPTGLTIDHLCRNRLCVNPAHLEAVTHLENVRRGEKAQRRLCEQGHPLYGGNIGWRQRGENGGYYRRCRLCALNYSRRRRGLSDLSPEATQEWLAANDAGPASVGKVVSL